jgi:hypothetical protein
MIKVSSWCVYTIYFCGIIVNILYTCMLLMDGGIAANQKTATFSLIIDMNVGVISFSFDGSALTTTTKNLEESQRFLHLRLYGTGVSRDVI